MPLHRRPIRAKATGRPPRWSAAALLAGMLLVAGASLADDTPARTLNHKVALSCAVEIDRYCGDLSDSRGAGRNAAICLKSYRNSLSAPCRRAVKAVFR